MVRRSVFFALTLLVVGWAGYQLAWHPELLGGANEITKSVGAIVIAALAAALAIWAVARPNGWKVILAFVLGIVATKLGGVLWGAIGFAQLGWLGLGLVCVGVLYAGTVLSLTGGWFASLRQTLRDRL